MPDASLRGADRTGPRRWSFAGCIFDEASWSLIVEGQRVLLEAKPLALLRELLVGAGKVVSKDQLLDAIWPDVTVVEASLSTAVYKLRGALRDDGRERRIIETVPAMGYRLAVPIEVDDPAAVPAPVTAVQLKTRDQPREAVGGGGRPPTVRIRKLALAAGLLMIASTLVAFQLFQPKSDSAANTPLAFSQRDAKNALRRLDVVTIERMLAAGWDPNRPFDREGNAAVNYVLNTCEWDRGHDRHRLLLVVRTLFDAGAQLDHRNMWGDTPYSIARADRYCGPNHPVTEMLHTLCYAGYQPLGDRCLASYQLARRRVRG